MLYQSADYVERSVSSPCPQKMPEITDIVETLRHQGLPAKTEALERLSWACFVIEW